ncbi:peroxisomal membrane protein (Partial), partial [Seminavis robusta]
IGVVIFFSTYFYVYEIIDALVSFRLPIMSAASAKVAESFGPVLMTNYYFWPAINWISFNYVPVQLRVLVNNVVGVLWNAFLCAKLAG